jgi:hypothetical protein
MSDPIMDLAHHAADKVKLALSLVTELIDDPVAKSQIAIMASSVCIGAAAGYLDFAVFQRDGVRLGKDKASIAVLNLLKLNVTDGADAVVRSLRETAQSAVQPAEPS